MGGDTCQNRQASHTAAQIDRPAGTDLGASAFSNTVFCPRPTFGGLPTALITGGKYVSPAESKRVPSGRMPARRPLRVARRPLARLERAGGCDSDVAPMGAQPIQLDGVHLKRKLSAISWSKDRIMFPWVSIVWKSTPVPIPQEAASCRAG